MTNPTEEVEREALLAVAQADREAAANAFDMFGHTDAAEEACAGMVDNHELIQAFARHRLEALRSGERVERLIGQARALRDVVWDHLPAEGHESLRLRRLASDHITGLEALSPSPGGSRGEVIELDIDDLVGIALNARVPGGAEVAAWLPSVDGWQPAPAAHAVMKAAVEAVVASLSSKQPRGGVEGGDSE